MKKSKQLFKFLFIIGIFLFYSCEKDDLVLNDKELSNSNPFKIEKLTFQQASKNHKLIEKLNTFSSNSNFNKRIISNYDNDIFIDTRRGCRASRGTCSFEIPRITVDADGHVFSMGKDALRSYLTISTD